MSKFYNSKILVVDDNDDNLELIEDFLEDDGYKNIICTRSAKGAYDILSKESIDLIILDIMMPEIDGLEACRYIKTHEKYKNIPIVIATAKADLNTLKAGFEAGANDYVRKPITNDVELLARVKNALTLKFQYDYIKNVNELLDKKIEEEVAKSHKKDAMMQEQTKLAAMGEMIGAVAHQWRQPLNALNINIQNLDDDFEEGLINKEFIESFIQKNTEIIQFMSDTIDDFRNFFRIDKEKVDFSVLDTLKKVLNMQSSVLKNYNIAVEIIGEDFIINGLKNEFAQVIMSLISNAKDALIENKVKNAKITINLSDDKITISNNGTGIDEKIINRVFEPYFTTKEQGMGTGMGLYMSKMIIENNMNGKISVENIDDGVSFTITLNTKKV